MSDRIIGILVDSFPKLFISGLTKSIPLTLIAFTLGLVLAVILALIQHARIPVLTQLARVYIWIMRGTPLLVQLFVVFFGFPNLGIYIDPFPTAILVFSLNEGAYSAETMRAALEAVPPGQMEAGYCVGMSYMQIMRRIVLPQAFRTAFPPLSNALISMVKDTSLAMNVTYAEMFFEAKKIASRNFEHFALYCEVAVIYLVFSTVLTLLQRLCERALEKRGYSREVVKK